MEEDFWPVAVVRKLGIRLEPTIFQVPMVVSGIYSAGR